MVNMHNLFQQFNSDLQITDTKRKKIITSMNVNYRLIMLAQLYPFTTVQI
jgi:hypothetical protein